MERKARAIRNALSGADKREEKAKVTLPRVKWLEREEV
jgi:hypothetical protein